jgi:hypothetical protein
MTMHSFMFMRILYPWWLVALGIPVACAMGRSEPAQAPDLQVMQAQVPAASPIRGGPDLRLMMQYALPLPADVCEDQDSQRFLMWSGPYRNLAPFFWGWPIESTYYVSPVEVLPAEDARQPVLCLIACDQSDASAKLEFLVAPGFSGRARCAASPRLAVDLDVVEGGGLSDSSVRVYGMTALDKTCQRIYGLDRCQQWGLTRFEDHWTRRAPAPPLNAAPSLGP